MQSGSDTLWNKRPNIDTATLSEAVHDAREFVQECINGRGSISDCSDYGGCIQIGVVDANGFRWANPPAHLHQQDKTE